jgi:hypothetical protein
VKEFLARLNPTERRFVVGVAVVFFLVINIVWVWPHFGDWSDTKGRMKAARTRLVTFETGTNLIPDLAKKIGQYGLGQVVPEENQALQFSRTVMSQTTLFGIIPQNVSYRKELGPTNSFFVEQSATMSLDTTEKQLVDFLYSVGASSNSLIRVKSFSAQPDASHQRLNTRVTLVASYQKSPVGVAGTTPAAGQKPAATPPKPAAGTANKPATTPAPNNGKPAVPVPNKAKPTLPVVAPKKPEANNRATNNFVPLARPGQINPNTK